MPARVVVFGGDSTSCISTELNTVGTLVPASPFILLSILLFVPGPYQKDPVPGEFPYPLLLGRHCLLSSESGIKRCGAM